MVVEEMFPGIYRIQVPLPKNPLQYLNSYVVKSPERNLLIDTGLNIRVCLEAMQAGLEHLGVDLAKTDFFITHYHADHAGLLRDLAGEDSVIYTSHLDIDVIRYGADWKEIDKFARRNGFPAEELEVSLKMHPGYRFNCGNNYQFTIVEDGSLLEYGEYRLTCVHTPGHTPGHMTLYDREKKIYFSGDHLLAEITPNISQYSNKYNHLKDYLNSLDKIYNLDINLVLPGHRSVINNHRKRISELKQHHRDRLEEVHFILEKGSMTAFEVAAHMSWDIIARSWDDFPSAQKWFAASEAGAHLRYLQEEGSLRSYVSKDKVYYEVR